MLTHYIDLSHCGGPVLYELFGRVLKAAHLSAHDGQTIVVDWPMWKDEPGVFGQTMRLLGPQASIEHCLAYIQPLLTAGLLAKRCEVSAVPDNAKLLHGYRRDRKPDSGSPCHIRRLQRRAQARGEAFEDITAPWIRANHSLPMQSATTGQRFHIYIERVPAEALSGNTPNQYGFGLPVPSFGHEGEI